ncbi:triacylglycerol lipase OBL1-like [Corylus avellana]|uniref:triacylglycerol lipase OBL1-like n=1 Tax=Corylus avellana TaxID=13451 RepID=UPI00286D3189|nr:triacylglycerol lipase OBL1-like [Corylus avellana]
MGPCESDQFCDHYLLESENASLYDLVRFLLSSTSETSRFIHRRNKEKDDFWRRWYIFNSLLAQKLLLYWGKPLVQVGHMLELWLNLLSQNGGFLVLLSNLLKGNVVWPDRSSATFTSVLGNLDQRVELDKNIRPENPKYNASLAMMASKLAYENEAFVQTTIKDQWRMEYLGFYNFWNDYMGKVSTQAMMFQDTRVQPNLIVVAFRGTSPFDPVAWQTDVDLSWFKLEGVGKIHAGFFKALGRQKGKGWPKEIQEGSKQPQYAYYVIRQRLREILEKNESAKFILTGHSLGGALAILFVTVLAMHEEELLLNRLEGVYTFGQPRVGDKQLGDYMKEKLKEYNVRHLRYVYCHDMVPRIPYDDEANLFFEHWGPCIYYNSFYKGKVRYEEPNKNYFSLLWAIPKYLNAAWELNRSFLIPYILGPDYEESWLMKMIRVVGLVFPGLAAHCPQDYVNATRLGCGC